MKQRMPITSNQYDVNSSDVILYLVRTINNDYLSFHGSTEKERRILSSRANPKNSQIHFKICLSSQLWKGIVKGLKDNQKQII